MIEIKSIIIFIIAFIFVILLAYTTISDDEPFRVFRIKNKKFKMRKIYNYTEDSWLYIEKDEKDEKYIKDEKDEYNFICHNYELVPINKDIYLLEKI
jgi:hypothetical protein